jgi:hypothetical protein
MEKVKMATNSVRCKVRCDFNNFDPDRSDIPASLSFSVVYDPDPKSENGKFFSATPTGSISLGVVNPDAAASFETGKLYYVDFEVAPDLKGEKTPKDVTDPKPPKEEVVEPGPTVADVVAKAESETTEPKPEPTKATKADTANTAS